MFFSRKKKAVETYPAVITEPIEQDSSNSHHIPETKQFDVPEQGYSCQVTVVSETGPTRQGNEDSLTYQYPSGDKQTLFAMVADGMGGHNAGEVASNMACEMAKEFIAKQYQLADTRSMLEIMVNQLHQAIQQAGERDSRFHGMGTTVVSVFIHDEQLWYAHVGDSRLYRFRKGKLEQITHDHTLVNQMVAEGKITAEEAEHHDMKNVLLQALGTVAKIQPELPVAALPIEQGDRYFLCSDGIYDAIQPKELDELFNIQKPGLVIETITALCNHRRARDNFSAILIDIGPYEAASNHPDTREQNIFV